MVEVWIDWKGLKRVGTLHRTAGRGRERVSFTYHDDWLADENAFGLRRTCLSLKGNSCLRQGKTCSHRLGILLLIPGAER